MYLLIIFNTLPLQRASKLVIFRAIKYQRQVRDLYSTLVLYNYLDNTALSSLCKYLALVWLVPKCNMVLGLRLSRNLFALPTVFILWYSITAQNLTENSEFLIFLFITLITLPLQ